MGSQGDPNKIQFKQYMLNPVFFGGHQWTNRTSQVSSSLALLSTVFTPFRMPTIFFPGSHFVLDVTSQPDLKPDFSLALGTRSTLKTVAHDESLSRNGPFAG